MKPILLVCLATGIASAQTSPGAIGEGPVRIIVIDSIAKASAD